MQIYRISGGISGGTDSGFWWDKAAGIEPASSCDVTLDSECSCGMEQCVGAANALHSGDSNWHCPSPIDSDLQIVIKEWTNLPTPIRKAVLALVTCR